jgi:steroid delta-isomerase-like uncharacterized protein
MSQESKAVLDRLNEEVFRRGNVDAVDELVAEDFVEHDPPPGMGPDREGFKDLVRALHRAFADQEHTIHDQIAEGDRVVERWTMTGTHTGEWFGIAPTNRRISIQGIDISRLQDGRLVEHWTQIDALGMFEQLGAMPAEQPASA